MAVGATETPVPEAAPVGVIVPFCAETRAAMAATKTYVNCILRFVRFVARLRFLEMRLGKVFVKEI